MLSSDISVLVSSRAESIVSVTDNNKRFKLFSAPPLCVSVCVSVGLFSLFLFVGVVCRAVLCFKSEKKEERIEKRTEENKSKDYNNT